MRATDAHWQTNKSDDLWGSEMVVYTASDFAGPIARRAPDCARHGVVAVDKGRLHSRGWCSCGWQGKQHLMPAVRSTTRIYTAS